jgi:hypothetical protein
MSKTKSKSKKAPKAQMWDTMDYTIITGKTRDEVAQKFQELKASCEGASLMAGAVGRKADGTFELRIDFIKS